MKQTGRVKWFNENKGYGFILQDNGRDVFVHYSEIQQEGYRTLTEGELVEYELTDGPKGPQARNVVRTAIPSAAAAPSAPSVQGGERASAEGAA